MTESMTSPQSRHFHPDNGPPLVAPAASSSLVATINPWQREQVIVGLPADTAERAGEPMKLWRRAAETGESNALGEIRKREGQDSQLAHT